MSLVICFQDVIMYFWKYEMYKKVWSYPMMVICIPFFFNIHEIIQEFHVFNFFLVNFVSDSWTYFHTSPPSLSSLYYKYCYHFFDHLFMIQNFNQSYHCPTVKKAKNAKNTSILRVNESLRNFASKCIRMFIWRYFAVFDIIQRYRYFFWWRILIIFLKISMRLFSILEKTIENTYHFKLIELSLLANFFLFVIMFG